MRNRFLLAVSVLLISCAGQAGHEKIAIDLPIGESSMTLPSGATGTIVVASDQASPFVIMYHGYGSQKDEVGNMYKDLASVLQDKGINSLRIGYRGWDSDAPQFDQEFITVDTMLEDAQEALDFVLSLPYADENRVGVLGFSMGGGIAQIVSGRNPDDVAAMATWSSSIAFAGMVSDDDKAAARRDGAVTIDLGWRTITHSAGFVDSIEAYDPLSYFSAYTSPLLIVDGTDDFLYPNTAVLQGLRPDAEVYEIQGADHIYHVLSGDDSMARDAMSKTAMWFAANL